METTTKRSRVLIAFLVVLVAFIIDLVFYVLFFQSHLISKRELFFAFTIFFILLWPVYRFLNRFLLPHLRRYSGRNRIILLMFSLSVRIIPFGLLSPIPLFISFSPSIL